LSSAFFVNHAKSHLLTLKTFTLAHLKILVKFLESKKAGISRKDAKTQRKDRQNSHGFTLPFATFAALRETSFSF
jgi:hypothetical protein